MKRLISYILAAALTLSLTACGKTEPVTEKQIFAMDTYMTLRAYGDQGEAALAEVIAAINAASAALDPELEKSEVYAMNHAGGAPTSVSDLTISMLNTAATLYARTDGALDLTVYPIVQAWGFIDQAYTVPDEQTLTALRQVPCFDAITIDGSTVTLPDGARLSFGAIAKGALAEQSAQILRDRGVTSAFLSLGGNVQTLGLKPDGSSWRIGVEDPANSGSYLGIVTVGEAAVVTSGSYQRYFEADGKLYHHIIDPATAAPSESGLVSVTIVCDSGTMADGLSTAMFILGEEGALDYRARYGGFEMILVTEDDRVIVTGGLTFEETAEGYVYEYAE